MILINIEIERLGLTQAQAAKVLGVAQSDVSNLARGRGRTYSFERLAQFLHALGVSVSIVTKKGKKTDTIVLHA